MTRPFGDLDRDPELRKRRVVSSRRASVLAIMRGFVEG
jgi:hypothetical protein